MAPFENIWKSDRHGIAHFNALLSRPGPSTGNVLWPACPLTPHHPQWTVLQPAKAFSKQRSRWASLPRSSATPAPSRYYSPQQNFNFFWKNDCLGVLFLDNDLELSGPPTRTARSWVGWRDLVFSISGCLSIQHRAWLLAESREPVRGRASDGSNEHQAESQGQMNEPWLPFRKPRNVGTELGAGVRSPQWLLSVATSQLR